MAFQTSPGVNISEIDLTNVVPAVATTEGAIAGVFRWGPEDQRILVTSEQDLANRFGKPASYYTDAGLTTLWNNYETWFSAANFLAYSDALYVTRVTDATAAAATGTNFNAKYKGKLGNSIQVSHCVGANMGVTARSDTLTIEPYATTGIISGLVANTDPTYLSVGDRIVLSTGIELVVSAISAATTDAGDASKFQRTITFDRRYNPADGAQYASTFSTQWGDADLFDSTPSTATRMHVVVRDNDGEISGTAGTILEIFEDIDTASAAVNPDGSTNFSPDVFTNRSDWISCTPAQAVLQASLTFGQATLASGSDGLDEVNITVGDVIAGYNLYTDPADVDVSLIIQGKAKGSTLANHIINNVCEVRKDCVAFISPELSDLTVANMTAFAAGLTASTFAVVDSGYKYQYDKYADVYRWIPLNADIAGLCARTDDVRDPWFSPAGYSRGNIKNVVKLQLNPAKAERDVLYKAKINPVITQPGQGTVLFGDKTFAPTTSAFDRINVRRLFIVLEKAIGVAAKSTLFEFNDDFTRAQFKNLVEPFLRDVQGRRGIYDFRVVCDETNNTSNVIDSNQFVGDIFIKPARSINFIQLNFVAVRSGVEFSEVVGQF
tara:strand:- start:7625 stop:9448 length:1824 start_codon:yes stop_codon:yes gene_type:complete